jgi:hypothetical protein
MDIVIAEDSLWVACGCEPTGVRTACSGAPLAWDPIADQRVRRRRGD